MIRSSLCLVAILCGLSAAPTVAAGSGNAGTYLAGLHAGFQSDFAKAAEYYTRALTLDAQNTSLMEKALTAQVSLGHFDRAVPIMRRIQGVEFDSPLANIVQLTEWMAEEDYTAAADNFASGFSMGGLLDGLVQPWVALGEGRMADALAGFDDLAQQPGLRNIAFYHKALALASAGDFGGADDILSGRAEGVLSVPRRGIVAHIQILSQLERNSDALTLIERAFGGNPPPVFDAMVDPLTAGDAVPFDIAATPRAGMAEAFYSVGQALLGETADTLTLLYTRTASELDPSHVDALLMTATILENEEQYDLATGVYDLVPTTHPAYLNAEFGRADALRFSGRTDAAIEVLRNLSKTYPDRVQVQEALGDVLRREEKWVDANAAYDKAVALLEEPRANDWRIFFARGIVLERQEEWAAAEADFRQALVLSPNQPAVLNYLGYSLVEQQVKLDEALTMIETAVRARPDDGYIIDSLGWVLFRLGRYEEAVQPMERAVELMAVDPVINDHLGDVYWAVGRKLEAAFQWRRALSFVDYGASSDEVNPDRMRRKLDVGLDQVLEEEGAAPLVRPEPVSD